MQRESILADALFSTSAPADDLDRLDSEIASALHVVRTHLGMEVGFVSQFLGEERVFRQVDSSIANPPLKSGQRLSMDAGYCCKVVLGELPELIPDTSLVPAAMDILDTSLMPIGSHISVPIRLKDGSVYGTFCCFSSFPDTSLRARDLHTMRAVADMVARQVEARVFAKREYDGQLARIAAVLADGQPRIVYQPIVGLADMRVVGCEALSRFSSASNLSPDRWFSDAAAVGLRTELELTALHKALECAQALWDKGFYIAVNLSPNAVLECDLVSVLKGQPLDKIVLELTEHDHVDDYEGLTRALAGLRAAGLRIAVDDAGSGYASLRHVLNLRPDIIKLDVSLTRGIDLDPVRQALAAAIVSFGAHVGCNVVAEGIETGEQLAVLRNLGVALGQGYFLAQPSPIESLQVARKTA